MATDSREVANQSSDSQDLVSPKDDWYDRSSLLGDFTVLIADQSVEDFLRRCPENRLCELIDGVVYLHAGPDDWAYEEKIRKSEGTDEFDPMKQWYDRSSLVGDYMVMIPDQTEADYLRRCPEGKVCEWIDGVVYMPSPATLWHQFAIQFLSTLLEMFTSRRHVGIVLTGPAALKIRPGRMVEPDLFVIPHGGEAQFHDIYCDPPVLLVVEILSKSTRSHDLNSKAALYREAGAIEVWFVDERDQALIIHRQAGEGYDVERIHSGPYSSRAIPGFWIEVSWLWERPRPDLTECLDLILAGPPT